MEVAGSDQLAWRILDLGCGTGQCGEAVRPLATFLAGVDLSPRMIAKARELSSVLAGCARALRADGLMAFSVENSDGDTYRLCPTGRYAHSVAYIDATADASGMCVVYRRDIIIRRDPAPIPGQIVVLSRAV